MDDQETGPGERPRARGQRISLFGRELPLPASRSWRIALGSALVGGGILGFLPILGFWMIPLGLLVLSVDLIFVRRWRRRTTVKWGRSRSPRSPLGTAGESARGPGTPPPA
ncbi:hypothetical protein [Aurantimonas marianensis]|uniref:Uncharacterized protein n=1 Tax=Aurantimonas marianensis TaxID=2920428 RepID=A0A9X2KFR7_9HYPH|nr:hypothetical protein [Aurantimonas marianensis]MCP3055661.1 hypothetical protein [Aurantimonas marianensis]